MNSSVTLQATLLSNQKTADEALAGLRLEHEELHGKIKLPLLLHCLVYLTIIWRYVMVWLDSVGSHGLSLLDSAVEDALDATMHETEGHLPQRGDFSAVVNSHGEARSGSQVDQDEDEGEGSIGGLGVALGAGSVGSQKGKRVSTLLDAERSEVDLGTLYVLYNNTLLIYLLLFYRMLGVC